VGRNLKKISEQQSLWISLHLHLWKYIWFSHLSRIHMSEWSFDFPDPHNWPPDMQQFHKYVLLSWFVAAVWVLSEFGKFLSFPFFWTLLPSHCSCSGLLLHLITLSDTHTHTHTLARTTLDQGSARRRDLYLTIHNTHNRQTAMPPPEFEPAIPVSECRSRTL
jgi:hypothetical protein